MWIDPRYLDFGCLTVRKLIDMRFRVLALALVTFWPVTASAAEIVIVDSGELPNVPRNSGGWTLLESGNSKGQIFTVKEAVALKSLTLKVKDVAAAGDIRVQFMPVKEGVPGVRLLLDQNGKLPVSMEDNQSIRITFDMPLDLEMGEYAFILSTESAKLRFALGEVHRGGRLIRKNKATKGKWLVGASRTGGDFVFALAGLPLDEFPSVEGAKSHAGNGTQERREARVLTRDKNPGYSPIKLSENREQPNIITVMVDDLGWNQIGVPRATMGSNGPEFLTPHLKRLAEEGLCFTNAYAQPNCAPTRAAMLSGQYPGRANNGVYVVGNLNRFGKGGVSREEAKFKGPPQSEDVAAEAITVAEALKANGYRTAHIGKYHVGGHRGSDTLPENVGFDINIGGYTQGHQPVCFASENKEGKWLFRGLGRGNFDRFAQPYDMKYLKRYQLPPSLSGSPKHISDAVADAMDETVAALASEGKPFYLQVHPYAVHGPVRSRPDLKANAQNDEFYGFVQSVDSIIGRLMTVMEDPNGDGVRDDSISRKTVVFFTSDNGGTHKTNVPLSGTKGMFTEGGIRVPLIAWWPGKIPAKTVTGRMVHSVDYYPTYLELAGSRWIPAEDVHPLDGISFLNSLLDPEIADRGKPVFYQFPGYLDQRAEPCVVVMEQINGAQYKLIYQYEADQWSLYNITQDVSESKNCLADEPETASRLANSVRLWLQQKHPTWKPKFPIVKDTGAPAEIPSL